VKLSEQLQQNGSSVLAAKAEALELALLDAKLFAISIKYLGRIDCKFYKHKLEVRADQTIECINKALEL